MNTNEPADTPADTPKEPRQGDYIDPLSEEDEVILDQIEASFTEADMDAWARQMEEEAARSKQQNRSA